MKKYGDDCFEVIITISNETPSHMIINELSDWFVAVLGGVFQRGSLFLCYCSLAHCFTLLICDSCINITSMNIEEQIHVLSQSMF